MSEHDDIDSSEQPDGGTSGIEQQIEARFDTVARAVDLGDPSEMLGAVRATATKRRRRRQGVGAIAAVGALGLSGVVLANVTQGDDGDLVVSAPITDPAVETESDDEESTEQADSAAADDGTADDDATAEEVADAVEVPDIAAAGVLRVTPTNREITSDSTVVIEQGAGFGFGQLYPWNGGFLSIREDSSPQPLPLELPDSVTEKFPPEVRDLFPDGLPPTIQEATEILQEAGLFDVVSEIVLADPEVSQAIYSQQSEVVRTVRFSEDGIEWRDIDTAFPVTANWGERISTGDRFALVNRIYPDTQAGGGADRLVGLEVWSSTDLIEWDRQEVPLPAVPEGLPDFVSYNIEPAQIAVNDAGWVLPFFTYVNVEAERLVEDEELARELAAGQLYAGSQITDTGVRVEIYDPFSGDSSDGPALADTLEFTWDELGVDSSLSSAWSGPGGAFTAAAPWGGVPVQAIAPDGSAHRVDRAYATQDGFIGVGATIDVSADGVRWSSVGLPIEGYVDWALDTESGLVIAVTGGDGAQQLFVFDMATSEFSQLDLAELPQGVSPEQTGQGFVMLARYEGDDSSAAFGAGGSRAVAEADGYRFELNLGGGIDDGPLASYTLTILESGEVVSSESLSTGDADFEFADEEYDDEIEGFRLFDPESGEELLFITFESMTYTPLGPDGEALDTVDGSVFSQDFSEPTMFLLASVGNELIVEQLSGPDTDGAGFGVSSVAVSGDVVLAANFDGTFLRLTPEG